MSSAPNPPAPGVADSVVDAVDVELEDQEFGRLEPLFVEFAAVEGGSQHAELRERLVTGYLPLARRLALKFVKRGVSLEDLTQVASIGLMNAVDRFDPELGSPFLGFAIPTIQGEIRRYFRDRTWSMKVPRGLKERHVAIARATAELSARLNRAPRPSELAQHLNLSVDDVLEGLQAAEAHTSASLDLQLTPTGGGYSLAEVLGDADAQLELVEYRHTLRPLIEALPERERAIVMLRFFSDMTQSQIAAEIGMSQMHVSRLLTKVLATLRRELEDD